MSLSDIELEIRFLNPKKAATDKTIPAKRLKVKLVLRLQLMF